MTASVSAFHIIGFHIVPDGGSGLVIEIGGGLLLSRGRYIQVANTRITLDSASANFVEIDDEGVISSNLTAFTTGRSFLYLITTANGNLSAIQDWRGNPGQTYPPGQFTNVGVGGAATATSPVNITGLPTSNAGLVTGDVWLNSNVLTIIP